ncbi:MAG: hypothetical protein BYD32DRAFT_481288 [Podila humilis]|nr:MAG: hypothetical protein BYD32DRAFT_481288 [Podila humilis]
MFISSSRTDINGFINLSNLLLQQKPAPPTIPSIKYGFNKNQVSFQAADTLSPLEAQASLLPLGDGGIAGCRASITYTTFVPTFLASCTYVTFVGATKGQPEVGAELSARGFSNYSQRTFEQDYHIKAYLKSLGTNNQGLNNA